MGNYWIVFSREIQVTGWLLGETRSSSFHWYNSGSGFTADLPKERVINGLGGDKHGAGQILGLQELQVSEVMQEESCSPSVLVS